MPGAETERRSLHADERRMAEEGDVEHRPLLAPLDDHEDGEQRDARRRARRRSARSDHPTELPRRSPKTIRKSATEKHTSAGEVGATGFRIARLVQLPERDHERERADGHVDEEDPAPTERVGDDAAEQRADGDGETDGRPPDGDRAHRAPAPDTRLRSTPEPSRTARRPRRPAGRARRRAWRCSGATPQRNDAHGEDARRRSRRRAAVRIDRRATPAVRISAASVSAYASTTHCSPVRLASSESLHARQGDVHDRDVDQEHERRHADGDQRPAAIRAFGRHRAILGTSDSPPGPPRRRFPV